MNTLRISPELAISPLEREMLLCQDAAYLETEPIRTLAYGKFNIAVSYTRVKYADWLIPSKPMQVDDEEVVVETLHFDTCTVNFNGKGKIGMHEIGLHAVRGLIGFKVDEPVLYDIVDEVFTEEGPRLVLNTSSPEDIQAGIVRNSRYITKVIEDWEEKKRQGLTDYPISARATEELTAAVINGKPLTQEKFRDMVANLFSDPDYAARYYGFK